MPSIPSGCVPFSAALNQLLAVGEAVWLACCSVTIHSLLLLDQLWVLLHHLGLLLLLGSTHWLSHHLATRILGIPVVDLLGLLLLHDRCGHEGVDVGQIAQIVRQQVLIKRLHSSVIDKVLALEKVVSLLLHALEESLTLSRPEVTLVNRVVPTHAPSLRKLLLEGAFLGLSCRVGSDTTSAEVVEHLAWHLLKSLLRQHHRVAGEVPEGHKLDNIGCHLLLIDVRVKGRLIGIELIHGGEVSTTDSHNNDGEGQLRPVHNLIDCLLQVTDDSIGDDEQDVVLLIGLVDAHILSHLVHELDNGREVGGPVQVDSVDGVFVDVHDPLDTVDLRVEDVTVQGEAVVCSVAVGWDCGAKTKDRDLLVGVVVLEDASNRLNRLEVLVLVHVEVMERVGLRGLPIRQGEVNGDCQANLTATEDVLEEGVPHFDLQLGEGQHVTTAERL